MNTNTIVRLGWSFLILLRLPNLYALTTILIYLQSCVFVKRGSHETKWVPFIIRKFLIITLIHYKVNLFTSITNRQWLLRLSMHELIDIRTNNYKQIFFGIINIYIFIIFIDYIYSDRCLSICVKIICRIIYFYNNINLQKLFVTWILNIISIINFRDIFLTYIMT